jgi:hypothetical protein
VGPLDHVVFVGRRLDALAIPWTLGGSLAGSLLGEPRSTNDIDLAIRLGPAGVPGLVAAVEDDYYAPLGALQTAAASHGSFNLIHLTSRSPEQSIGATPQLHRARRRRREQSRGESR